MIGWLSLGFFYNPLRTITLLSNEKSKNLLLWGVGISISGVLSLTLADALENDYFSSVMIARLLPYYFGYFFLVTFMTTCALLLKKRFNIHKMIGLLLLTDFPLVLTLPLMMISLGANVILGSMGNTGTTLVFFSGCVTLIVFYTWLAKIFVFARTFRISIPQTIGLAILPSILMVFLFILGLIDIIQQIIKAL